ncbi:PRC-barrel domain containing protein [Haladaptatus halobius]|uniref:PRC-barrel domain containing protein n=1 Tax=Haladaptatus halobius TaxID=2884875 RepID=UPI001D0B7047|nr:PRC-barrel domain containing protein [Haladaptatus halobius]
MVEFTEEEKGKDVVDPDGKQVGIVADVKGNTLYVDFDPGFTDELKQKLGFGDAEGTQAIESNRVAAVTETEIQLKRR